MSQTATVTKDKDIRRGTDFITIMVWGSGGMGMGIGLGIGWESDWEWDIYEYHWGQRS